MKHEWPHLTRITDPATLRAELETIRIEYNTNRLHSSIGYVTPDDEHYGRGETIRKARRDGLAQAAQARLTYNQNQRNQPKTEDHDEA